MGLSVPGACQRCCSLCSLLSAAAEEGSYNLDPLHPHYWTFLPFFSEDIVATTASVLWTRPPRTSARGVTASFLAALGAPAKEIGGGGSGEDVLT